MKTTLSANGVRMSRLTGVRTIMQDIKQTLAAAPQEPWINLSAGNPVVLPAVEAMWRRHAQALLGDGTFGAIVGRYGETEGYPPLIEALARLFRRQYGWDLRPENVLIAPGSQMLLFAAANCFCGCDPAGNLRRLLLPASPDYTGYDGICLSEEALTAAAPDIEIVDERSFKYRVDFERLRVEPETGMVLFSRPCNPSGNVLREHEGRRIIALAADHDVPVFIDAAYGPPFPNLAFAEIQPFRGDNVLYSMSLSKAGLPGERIGIAIGPSRYLDPLRAFLANATLHSARFGQALAARAIDTGDLLEVAATAIAPYYRKQFELLRRVLDRTMLGIEWYLHKFEGALFAWLWLKDLPLRDLALYEEIKKERVFVVPGSFFFPGIDDAWAHKHECLRISLTATEAELTQAAAAIARVVARVYGDNDAAARTAAL